MTDSITPKPEDIDQAIIEPNGQALPDFDLSRYLEKDEEAEEVVGKESDESVSGQFDPPAKPRKKYKKLPRSDWAIGQILARHAGLIGPTADTLGVHRDTLYKRVSESPTLQQARVTAIETVKDMAEGNVYRGIQNGDQKDTHFFLRTMGRDRGYVTSSEVSGPDGGEIKIVISPREAKL